MSDTAKDWRMVADLLAANVDRFEDVDLSEVIVLCRSEVDRLDREAARDVYAQELITAYWSGIRAAGGDDGDALIGARAVLAKVQKDAEWLLAKQAAVGAEYTLTAVQTMQTLAVGGMVLTADEVADVRRVLGMPVWGPASDRLRARFTPAEEIVSSDENVAADQADSDAGPWDRRQDVPDGVRYWCGDGRPNPCLAYWVNRDGVRLYADAAIHEPFRSGHDIYAGPFVRVDAEKPAPRSWPSLDKVPHDVVVEDCDGDRFAWRCGGWRMGDRFGGWIMHCEMQCVDLVGDLTEVSA